MYSLLKQIYGIPVRSKINALISNSDTIIPWSNPVLNYTAPSPGGINDALSYFMAQKPWGE